MSHRKWLPNFSRRRKRITTANPFATKAARELTEILIAQHIIESGQRVRIRRTYAGHHQRSAGAWSWYAENEDGREVCGSQFTVRDIVQAHKQLGSCVSVSFAHSSVTLFAEKHLGENCPNCRPED